MPVSAFTSLLAGAFAGKNPFQTLIAGATQQTPVVKGFEIFESRIYEDGDVIDFDTNDDGEVLGVGWGFAADAYGTFDSATYVQIVGDEQWLVSNPSVYGEVMGEVALTLYLYKVSWTLAWKATVLKVSPFDMTAAISMTTPGGWCRSAGGFRDSLTMAAEISETANECFHGILGDEDEGEDKDCTARSYYPQIALWEKSFGEDYEDKEFLQKNEWAIWEWECTEGYELDL